MNKRYPTIVVWWHKGSTDTELRLHDKTIEEARDEAKFFGYKPPVWYKPWQYITGGLGVVTVG